MERMAGNNFSIGQLDKSHKREKFSCGVHLLDDYLHKQASQDMRRHIAVTYILNDDKENQVAGYYTLSSTTIQLADLPEKAIKKLPHYPLLPATLIGRLAVNNEYQHKGLGEILLLDALKTIFQVSQTVASYAAVVDAINDEAINFYKKYGFISLVASKLYLPMKIVAEIQKD